MAWRSLLITQPSHLKLHQNALVIKQEQGEAQVMLEDIAAIVLDNLQITLTAQLLSAFAQRQIALITVDATHTPNGILQSFLPHSRALKVMKAQLALGKVLQKQLWQTLVKQKILNQAHTLAVFHGESATKSLLNMAINVKPDDATNLEAQAAQYYFATLFGKQFYRRQENLINAALNYGYSIVRSAITRSLVAYGCLPAFGLHHRNEQNAFNLADDLIEPFRPHIDRWVLIFLEEQGIESATTETLTKEFKAHLVSFLHQDLPRLENGNITGKATVIALIDMQVISLVQCYQGKSTQLVLPCTEKATQ